MVSGHAVGAEAATEAAQVQATTDQPVDEAKEEPVLPEPNGEYPGTGVPPLVLHQWGAIRAMRY